MWSAVTITSQKFLKSFKRQLLKLPYLATNTSSHSGPGKLLQNLVRVIADLRGKFWPDLGPEIVDLRLQSGHLGANCVHL